MQSQGLLHFTGITKLQLNWAVKYCQYLVFSTKFKIIDLEKLCMYIQSFATNLNIKGVQKLFKFSRHELLNPAHKHTQERGLGIYIFYTFIDLAYTYNLYYNLYLFLSFWLKMEKINMENLIYASFTLLELISAI